MPVPLDVWHTDCELQGAATRCYFFEKASIGEHLSMKHILTFGAVALLSTSAFAQESVKIGGAISASCTISNPGGASVPIEESTLAGIDGGATVEVVLGQFEVYCNQPSTLTMSSVNGALENSIDLSSVEDNGNRLIPYTLQVTSDNNSFRNETFRSPAGGLSGVFDIGVRDSRTSRLGIVDDTVTLSMYLNDDSTRFAQLADRVQDASLLYAGVYAEVTTLTISANN